MANYHSVDPKDQHLTTEGISDHSDLTVFYADAKKEVLGPWMQEADRQAALQIERDTITRGLRKSAFLIGLSTSLPVVLVIVLVQYFIKSVSLVNAIPILFLIIFGFGGFFWLTYALFKWVGNTFHNHTIKALPITLTILASLAFLTKPLFLLADTYIGGMAGYGAALGSMLLVSIFIAIVSIYIWTAVKIPAISKVIILVIFFSSSVACQYLI